MLPESRALRRLLSSAPPDEIGQALQLLRSLDHQLAEIEKRVAKLEELMPAALQKIGLVRFDADAELGGRVSFALALLDDNDNGILITSVHRLEGTRVFLREIAGGRTQHELLPEERKALNMALDEVLQARRRGKEIASRTITETEAPAHDEPGNAVRP
ncbi:MAG: DUF4446 family protein [Armatimonadetes bacterium]|nr:DUF4446 family protein [Armatimonadota bacterium]